MQQDRPITPNMMPDRSALDERGDSRPNSSNFRRVTRALSRAKSRIRSSGKINIPEASTSENDMVKSYESTEINEKEEKPTASSSRPPQSQKKAKKRLRLISLLSGKSRASETRDSFGRRGTSMYCESLSGNREEDEPQTDRKTFVGIKTSSRLAQKLSSRAIGRSVSHGGVAFHETRMSNTLFGTFGSVSREGGSESSENPGATRSGSRSNGESSFRTMPSRDGQDRNSRTNLELAMAQPNEETIEELFGSTSDCTGSEADAMSMQGIFQSLIAIENDI